MKRWIDLRSDTVTQPTQRMREAMFAAEVGDDLYGDDPTMARLEAEAAKRLGKEAALFVVSGTMGNQVAVMAHAARGEEVILGDGCHIMAHELGGAALHAGCVTRTVDAPDGVLTAGLVEKAIRKPSKSAAPTGVICLENALSNGEVAPLSAMREVYALAKEEGIPVHLDGARLFNAALALGVDVKELTACCDSVMACLSKGLCAPIGSMLAGSREFIERAWKVRRSFGGGLRQAGILATAGLVALEEMPGRLIEDHENARFLRDGLLEIPGARVLNRVDINMLFVRFDVPEPVVSALPGTLLKQGIKIRPAEDGVFRLMTHRDVTREDLNVFLTALRAALPERSCC